MEYTRAKTVMSHILLFFSPHLTPIGDVNQILHLYDKQFDEMLPYTTVITPLICLALVNYEILAEQSV